jgi:hypothetical protein
LNNPAIKTAEQFLAEHNIDLISPLMQKIQEIQTLQNGWVEPSTAEVWGLRIRAIQGSIDELLPMIEKNGPGKKTCEKLGQIKEQVKDRRTSVYEQYNKFKTIINDILTSEVESSNQLLEKFADKLQALQTPAQSVDEYLLSLGIQNDRNFSDYLEFSIPITNLANWGIQKIQDIDCLGLRSYDQEERTLNKLGFALEIYEGTVSEKTLKKAAQDCLKIIEKKLREDVKSDQLCIDNLLVLNRG